MAAADYSQDMQTEGAVSVEPSGSYILYHGGNNETHNQVLIGSPQNSEDPNAAKGQIVSDATPRRSGQVQTDNENEPEGVEANNCTAGFDQEEVLDIEDVGLDGTIINT